METKKIKTGIIGATGYAGMELIKLLLKHPNAEISEISSVSFEGKTIDEVYPSLYNVLNKTLVNEDKVIESSDVIFASLPHGLCEKLAKKAMAAGKKFIDLGADFRLENEDDFKEWYGLPYNEKELHEEAVYSIPELHRDKVNGKSLIANPGCYPTSIALGIAPAVINGLLDLGTIIIDSKSGTTGAGRGLSQTTHFPDCNESFAPYKVAAHRHTPEIEQTISQLSGKETKVTFIPHLLPINRGIVSTIYASLTKKVSLDDVLELYKDFYKNEQFVRVLGKGKVANLKYVKHSNYCDISVHVDERTNRLIIVSAIDNMVKGAAGQAIQNMNIMMGLKEDTGLDLVPPAF